MPKRGKRYLNLLEKVDTKKTYDYREAAKLVKELASAKFDETVEAHIALGIDPRKSDQNVRSSVVLPHGTGRKIRVVAIARGEKLKEAEEAGADYVGGEELVQKIKEGWLDFDAVVATPDMMGSVGKQLGRVLGPRGLMPNPKVGTVGFNIGEIIREVKAGRVEFRNDKTGAVHAPIGKASFTPEQIAENLEAFVKAVEAAKPDAAKGTYIRSVHIATTMGPSLKVKYPL